MSDEREEKQGFKVNDRRRFDSAGNDRAEGGSAQVKPTSAAVAQPQPKSPPSEAAPRSTLGKPELQGGAGDINFSSFILSLATQALMQLGEMPPPDGVPIEPDLDAARQTIAILGLIEEKTKGNLQQEEAELLTEVLHSCRISFVRRSKSA